MCKLLVLFAHLRGFVISSTAIKTPRFQPLSQWLVSYKCDATFGVRSAMTLGGFHKCSLLPGGGHLLLCPVS
jgi:hypothetical protein